MRKLRDTPITMRWSAPLPVLNPWYAALSSRFRRMRAILPKPSEERKSHLHDGQRPSFGAAHQESICILLEMQWINSASIHSGEYFHGPFEITETGTPFILLKAAAAPARWMIARSALSNVTRENCRLLTWKRWESTHCTPACANISAACCTTAYWMFTTGAGHRSQPPADHPPLYVESRILIR